MNAKCSTPLKVLTLTDTLSVDGRSMPANDFSGIDKYISVV